jgi:hypothetical protein
MAAEDAGRRKARHPQLPPPPPPPQQRSFLHGVNDAVMNVWLGFRTGATSNTADCLYVAHDATAAPHAADSCDAHGKVRLGEVRRRDALPPKDAATIVRFVVVSDTHSRHAEMGVLPSGDVFVHGGDLLMSSRLWSSEGARDQYRDLNAWLGSGAVRCPTKLVIAGNHDRELQAIGKERLSVLCVLFSPAPSQRSQREMLQLLPCLPCHRALNVPSGARSHWSLAILAIRPGDCEGPPLKRHLP